MRVMLVTGFYPGNKMGGAEYQTALLGKGLVNRGHEVIFLAIRAEREATIERDGIKIVELPGWRAMGQSAYRQRIAQIIQETAPDICYIRLLTELAELSALCKQANIPVASVTCSLRETTPFLFGYHPRETLGYLRSRQTFRHFQSFWAIRRSAAHICNTHELRTHMQPWLPGKPIHMIYNGSPTAPAEEIHKTTTGQVIWVNNFKNGKRPHLFVELARRLPQWRFVMIGNIAQEGRYGRWLKQMIEKAPSNLCYLGPLPVHETNKHISQSDLLVYTSKAGVEGFGNSFLQAWFRGVPTASLSFELDGILERERVGFFARTFDDLVTGVKRVMENEGQRQEMGERALIYAQQNYQVETMVDKHESLFKQVVEKPYAG